MFTSYSSYIDLIVSMATCLKDIKIDRQKITVFRYVLPNDHSLLVSVSD